MKCFLHTFSCEIKKGSEKCHLFSFISSKDSRPCLALSFLIKQIPHLIKIMTWKKASMLKERRRCEDLKGEKKGKFN